MKKRLGWMALLSFVAVLGATTSVYPQEEKKIYFDGRLVGYIDKNGRSVVIINAPRPSEPEPRERPERSQPDGNGTNDQSIKNGASYQADIFSSNYAAPGAFTEAVLAGNGQVAFSVRDLFPNNGAYVFRSKLSSPNGHHYWSLTSLGKSAKSPQQIMAIIMQDPDKVFQWFAATGDNGQRVTMNNIYHLTSAVGDNPVQVTRVTPYFFTFTALPGHMLRGSAAHGVLKDKTGELWLFQEGNGVPGEPITKRYINTQIASFIWRDMGDIIRYRIVEP